MVVRTKSTSPAGSLAEAATGPGYEALRFLSEQRLDHNPVNFALAWRCKTDRHSVPAMAVDAILMEGRRLVQADVDLITAAAKSNGGAAATEPGHDALRHQTLRLADIAAHAASRSSDFGRDLSAGLFQLSGGPSSVEQIVKAMVQRNYDIQTQLNAASSEIEELRQQVEISRDDAHRDALTGLLNRRGARREMSARRSSRNSSVALCDVDHFKQVNDTFGHGVGDRVLKAVGACLSQSLGSHTLARWGGEEFLVFLDGVTVAHAVEILEHARSNLADRTFRDRQTDKLIGSVTISIGVAPFGGTKQDMAIEAADRMLYEAKRGGRNRVIAAVAGTR
ncbi:diguanylate cyclase [Sphingomonas sp. HHU CXW]|uniref:diguanylate cyclase n=1 Tax=Sphingomonas hominis TaxID=2741495 RepID=A0ABX2JCV6_9SPHN|nr:GGDEF domain-containing protein [Sphingomonas hominis]NTS64173.1 diguanylate cyclase [Sphingomonas hominis]